MPGTLTPKDPEAFKRALRAQGVPESAFDQNQTTSGGRANARDAFRAGGYQTGGATIGGAGQPRVMLSGAATAGGSGALKTLLGH